jgi:hypothetical protein
VTLVECFDVITHIESLQVICKGTNAKIDGSFIATVLETASVVALYLAWRSITEGGQLFQLRFSVGCRLTTHHLYRILG